MSQSERSDVLSTIGMGNIRIVLTNQVIASDRISFHFNNPVNPPTGDESRSEYQCCECCVFNRRVR